MHRMLARKRCRGRRPGADSDRDVAFVVAPRAGAAVGALALAEAAAAVGRALEQGAEGRGHAADVVQAGDDPSAARELAVERSPWCGRGRGRRRRNQVSSTRLHISTEPCTLRAPSGPSRVDARGGQHEPVRIDRKLVERRHRERITLHAFHDAAQRLPVGRAARRAGASGRRTARSLTDSSARLASVPSSTSRSMRLEKRAEDGSLGGKQVAELRQGHAGALGHVGELDILPAPLGRKLHQGVNEAVAVDPANPSRTPPLPVPPPACRRARGSIRYRCGRLAMVASSNGWTLCRLT